MTDREGIRYTSPMRVVIALAGVGLLGALLSPGCRTPSAANIELRKQNQQLEDQVRQLRAENDQLTSDIRRLESDVETLPTLPQERLAQLWTVAGLRFGRLTGIDRRSEGHPLKVYLKPVDDEGATIKAAGKIIVEAFDLNAAQTRIGSWEIPLAEARRMWNSGGMLNEYILTLPWEGEPPAEGRKLLVKVTFEDALTQRTFEARTDVQ